jgi:hypothetical protein
MTVQELIAQLQTLPPHTVVVFTADMGHIETDAPELDYVYSGTPEEPEEPTLYINLDN